MGEMTVAAGLDLAMKGVAGRAGQSAVNARMGKQLFTLLGMAAQTGSAEIPPVTDLQGLMGVGMTLQAAGQGRMRSLLMAAVASGNNLHISRRVPLMAIQAKLLVGLALALQDEHNPFMTLDAIPCPHSGMDATPLLG